jgi:hypothetical protein
MVQLNTSGYLGGGRYVGGRLSLNPPLRTGKGQPCWAFRFEDAETESDHYMSLTGAYLGSRGYGSAPEVEIRKWVSVGNSRRGYLGEEQYKQLAMNYLRTSSLHSTNMVRFAFDLASPMTPDQIFVSKRFRDIVLLDIPLKREHWRSQTNGLFASEQLRIRMTKDGHVVKVEQGPCWVEVSTRDDTMAPNNVPEDTARKLADPQY